MLSTSELKELKTARALLETQGFAVRLQNMVGKPLIEGLNRLPKSWRGKVNSATEAALRKALDVAIKSLDESDGKTGASKQSAECADRAAGKAVKLPVHSNGKHKVMAAACGAFGGAFGLPALFVELPVSTTIMMRSIADIARCEGEDLTELEARLACVEVFALGGTGGGDDYADTGYYAVRALLAQQVSETIRHLAQGGAARVSASPIAKLIGSIASRFGIIVGEKAMAAAIPVVGAAGGAMINTMFIDHFQTVAQGHFIVRRLERLHGKEVVRAAYESLG